MSDSIHNALSKFRDTMLTAIAGLEFQIRDVLANNQYSSSMHQQTTYSRKPISGLYESNKNDLDAMSELSEIPVNTTLHDKITQSIQDIATRMTTLETQFRNFETNQFISRTVYDDHIQNELMSMEKQQNTKNILVSSVRNTPALAAAVAAANPPSFDLSDSVDQSETEESDVEIIEMNDEEIEDASVEEETLKKITIKGILYYIDPENAIYHETEDGYEQVGTYDSATDTIDPLLEEKIEKEEVVEEVQEVQQEEIIDTNDEEDEEEEEEAIEVEEFIYKGQTYQRDVDNNVYLDGEQVGTWNGKKIIPV